MQEIFASDLGPRLPYASPRRVAILLWRFRQTRPGEAATTTWRRVIPPPLATLQSPGLLHSTFGHSHGDHLSQLMEAESPAQSGVAWNAPWPNSPPDSQVNINHVDIQQADGQHDDFHFYPEPPASFPVALETSLPGPSFGSSSYAHPPTPFSSQTPASRLSFNEGMPSGAPDTHESAPQQYNGHRQSHCEGTPMETMYTECAVVGHRPSGLGLETLHSVDFNGFSQEQISEYYPGASSSEALSNIASSQILLSMNGGLPPPTATLPSMPAQTQLQQSHPCKDARKEARSSSSTVACPPTLPSNILAPQPRHAISTDRLRQPEDPITPISHHGQHEEYSHEATSQIDHQEATSQSLARPYDPDFCADGELLAQFATVSEHRESQARQQTLHWQKHKPQPPHGHYDAGHADEICGEGSQLTQAEAQGALPENAQASGYDVDGQGLEPSQASGGACAGFMDGDWATLVANDAQVQPFAKDSDRLQSELAASDWTMLDPETLHQNLFAHSESAYEELGHADQRPRDEGADSQGSQGSGEEVQDDARA